MKIFKFGGASVKDAESIKNITQILQYEGTENTLVVISAMGKMTNAFEEAIDAMGGLYMCIDQKFKIDPIGPKPKESFDKAGAYGIQEWIGLIGVTRLEGSYYNVMGLPVHKLYEELMKL